MVLVISEPESHKTQTHCFTTCCLHWNKSGSKVYDCYL